MDGAPLTTGQPSTDTGSQSVVDAAAAAATAAQQPTLDLSKPTDPPALKLGDPGFDATAAKDAADKLAADALADPVKAAADKAAKDAADKAAALPEKYELKVPDGFELNPEVDADFQVLAKDLKLTPEQAQRVGDLGVKLQTIQKAALDKAQAEWADASRADKEFGGDKLNESLGAANKALDAFGTPQFKEMLKVSKLGNHPELIRFLVRTGRAMSDDKTVIGRQGEGSDPKALEKRLYPNNP